MSNFKRKGVISAENLALNVDSDAEPELHWGENCSEESFKLSSDELSSDIDASCIAAK